MKTKITLLLTFILVSFSMHAQYKVSGVVKDETNQPIPGVSVVVEGTSTGTTTDFDGNYTIKVKKGNKVTFSSVGYTSITKEMDGSAVLNLTMAEGMALDEVVITGNRAKPRSVLDSPVPIDNISVKELKGSGKVQVEQMLSYTVPSFNSATQAISDATAHFDPADLRGLGPSRTLVLMNGKRMKQSSQIYLNGTPGKGEVGIDLKSFPNSAVKSIEVLRDGASAQYGSDAIAGVINIILKDDAEYSEINTHAGVTSQGDGFNMGIDYNGTVNVGEKGKLSLSLEYFKQNITNRAGNAQDTPGEAPDVADYGGNTDDPDYIRDTEFYNNVSAWMNENPDIGMIVGQPKLTKISGLANFTYPISEKSEFYTFHTITKRYGQSFAYYRSPFWRGDVQDAEFISKYEDFVGYHPTFETVVDDNMSVAGIKFDLFGFNTDASLTYGRNYVDYTVNNSVNRDYLADHGTSPRTFKPGGYAFSNFVSNLDFSKVFNDKVSTSFGIEYKREYYQGHKGDELSYYGGGSDSFAGIKPHEAMDVSRYNFASYAGLDYDFSEKSLLGAAIRYEKFSDFGSNFSWKLNGRYKVTDDIALRASTSTGFRAPSLHQRYITLTQYIIVSGNPDPQLQGTFANDSQIVENLNVPNLKAETSQNFSIGATAKLGKFNLSADIYQIKVNDRVLFSSQIGFDSDDSSTNPVEQILNDNGIKALQFFINAINTKTTGLDLVANVSRINLGSGKFKANLSMNFNNTVMEGDVANPKVLSDNGYSVFDHREQLRITDARPKSKISLGLNYDIHNFSFGLNNTRFGEVTVAGNTEADDQVHSAKIATDFSLGYEFSKNFNISVQANNIFDVYPDILHDGTNGNPDLRSAGGRFLYSSEVTQIGQLGRNYLMRFTLKF